MPFAPYAIDPGELRHQITIGSRSSAQDSSGQPLNTWPIYYTCRAKIEQLSGKQLFQGNEFSSAKQVRITIRWPSKGIVESLAVVTAGSPAVSTVTLSQAAGLASGAVCLLTPIALIDAAGAPVAFTIANGVLTVAGTYVGHTLTAAYSTNVPINVGDRIFFKNHIYTIQIADNVLERNRKVVLTCEELDGAA
jgi:SPP1 family predicted phage head-tail adaptor